MLATAPRFDAPQYLTSNAIGYPSWSPDGSQIAFAAFRPEDKLFTTMVINANGFALRDLLPDKTARTDAGTGYKVVNGWLDKYRILIKAHCGSGCDQLLQFDLRSSVAAPIFSPDQGGNDYDWSPNRAYVVVTAGANPQIGIASGTGGDIAWLSGHKAADPAWQRFWTTFVQWAQDSSRFLFLRQPDDASEQPELWVWDTRTRGSRLLSDIVLAAWSPQGDIIAFLSLGQAHFEPDGTWKAGTATAEGPNPIGLGLYKLREGKVIAFTAMGEVSYGYHWPDQLQSQSFKLMWSSNGEYLAYFDSSGKAWILAIKDMTQYEIDTNGETVVGLRWSPDGKKLAVSTQNDRLLVFVVPCSRSP